MSHSFAEQVECYVGQVIDVALESGTDGFGGRTADCDELVDQRFRVGGCAVDERERVLIRRGVPAACHGTPPIGGASPQMLTCARTRVCVMVSMRAMGISVSVVRNEGRRRITEAFAFRQNYWKYRLAIFCGNGGPNFWHHVALLAVG